MGDNWACSIPSLNQIEIDKLLQQKTQGLITLEQNLADFELDFCLIQSSLSSVVGGIGFAAYTAFNIFLDNYVTAKNKESLTPWFSLNWDGYDSSSLFDQDNSKNIGRSSGLNLVDLAINPDEAWSISQRAIATGANRIIVSPTELQPRIEQWIKPKSLAQIDQLMAANSLNSLANQKKADVSTEYIAPRNEVETQVVKAMEELLGLDSIGVDDNFFELGGHSLLAIQIVSRLREHFNVEIPMREFLFESPTAAKIANVINSKLHENTDSDELEKLLEQVESLSDAEARELLDK